MDVPGGGGYNFHPSRPSGRVTQGAEGEMTKSSWMCMAKIRYDLFGYVSNV